MERLQHDMIFINLPVSDLAASKSFYAGLGFKENEIFRDEHTASFKVSDVIVVMLLETERFNSFSTRPAVDPGGAREMLNCLSVSSVEDADELVRRATEFGGTVTRELAAEGPMYGGAFDDPDGHGWELMYFDPEALAQMQAEAGQ
ncbi:lactoylglutathione lyase [Corynebacterium deserti GIMN1.010]|uniref:Lactoylglutathione lyase n=1 Tax=Corynebacterium deserti GIMN1.010 TaxID=931089 RepID=A0A0M5IIE8_9CORY|nr:VOC family protein [Corynebacterium deserti]ALC05374.1 lactoylglutathione lyase [Corynebacterium deserti GIMN1.010]